MPPCPSHSTRRKRRSSFFTEIFFSLWRLSSVISIFNCSMVRYAVVLPNALILFTFATFTSMSNLAASSFSIAICSLLVLFILTRWKTFLQIWCSPNFFSFWPILRPFVLLSFPIYSHLSCVFNLFILLRSLCQCVAIYCRDIPLWYPLNNSSLHMAHRLEWSNMQDHSRCLWEFCRWRE